MLFSHWSVNPGLFLDTPTPDSTTHAPAFPACESFKLYSHFHIERRNINGNQTIMMYSETNKDEFKIFLQ